MNPLSIWARVALYGLLAVAITGAATAGYLHIKRIGRDEVFGELLVQKVAVNAKRAAIAAPIVKKEAVAQAQIAVVTETLIKEVPVYVKADDCPMPGGFRVLHDAAADGRLPDAGAIPDAASVPAQDLATTIADNYGTCQQTAARLSGLQEWVRAQVEVKASP